MIGSDIWLFLLAAIVSTIGWAIIAVAVMLFLALGPVSIGPFRLGEPTTLALGGLALWLLIFSPIYRAIVRSTEG